MADVTFNHKQLIGETNNRNVFTEKSDEIDSCKTTDIFQPLEAPSKNGVNGDDDTTASNRPIDFDAKGLKVKEIVSLKKDLTSHSQDNQIKVAEVSENEQNNSEAIPSFSFSQKDVLSNSNQSNKESGSIKIRRNTNEINAPVQKVCWHSGNSVTKNSSGCLPTSYGDGDIALQEFLPFDTENTEARKTSEKAKEVYWECSNCASPSTVSPSMSFEDDEDFEDAELPIFFIDSRERLFIDDWDSELSSNNSHNIDDEWIDANSMYDNLDNKYEEMRQKRSQEAPPLYPHRALLYMECTVCLTKSYLRRRVCCDFRMCHECMTMYVSVKVNEGKVQIECPNDRCNVLVHKDEVNERLPNEMKEKFAKFLIDANADPCQKTCPDCSKTFTIEPEVLSNKKKLKKGLRVICPQCYLGWCFLCHAPFHSGVSCKQYRKGDKMVKKWAKERSYGQSNAQKCPKCGIYIQRVHGCDHMKCTKCHTDFCYRCGDRYISIKLLGNHWSRFSPFGCKYRLMPKRPGLRRFIRGANFAARLVAGMVLAGLGLAAGAVLVGASVFIVPGYGIFMLKQHLWRKKQLKKFTKQKMMMIALAEGERAEKERDLFTHRVIQNNQGTSSVYEQMAVENGEDSKQVRVIVHRSLSFNPEESKDVTNNVYVNKYTADGTEVTISRVGGESSDGVVVVADVSGVQNAGGYLTVVANVISKVSQATDTNHRETDQNVNLPTAELSGKGSTESFGNTGTETLKEGLEKNIPDTTDSITLRKDRSDATIESSSANSDHQDSGFDEKEFDVYPCEDIPGENFQQVMEQRTDQDSQIVGLAPLGHDPNKLDHFQCKLKGDTDSVEGDNNGCFGNIFSKRIQTSPMTSEELTCKSPMPNLPKKFLSIRAATWEKCHCDKMQSLLRLSALDQKVEKNISRSPTSVTVQRETTSHTPSLVSSVSAHQLSVGELTLDLNRGNSTCMKDVLGENVNIEIDRGNDSPIEVKHVDCVVQCSSGHPAQGSVPASSNQLSLEQKLSESFSDDHPVSHHGLVTYL
ncbi:unnamed protein product [Lymnaea stagnalis]|uniref:RBR-type E3 ubiquitin transferase n=1 Tax=Lymnaea stagnalis TaxID=6523 RepID=A0AAV2HVS3_LYMST